MTVTENALLPAGGDFCYTLIDQSDSVEQPTVQELKQVLETGKDDFKIDAMRRILLMMLNGDPLNGILMHVIRFVMPSKNKSLKRLLLIYWEICPKYNSDGKLKQEMILVINALRNDAQHPNEYVRGMTLRFLCKLREPELLEPLVPAVRSCLEHRHSYVRRNALLALGSIYRHFEHLAPDAPELVFNYLAKESDSQCRRNAFTVLIQSRMQLAVQYFEQLRPQLPSLDEPMQLAVLELIRKDRATGGGTFFGDRSSYVQTTVQLLQSAEPSVKYDAATTLVGMTSHVSAVKAAAECYIELILKVSDNNIKLIVLDRLAELVEKYTRVLDETVMDMLRVLGSPDMEIRRRCLRLAMEMVSSKNVIEVVQFLKKEMLKTNAPEQVPNPEYRQLLVQSIHQCAIQYPEVAQTVVHTLMTFIGDSANSAAVDVVYFVRGVMERYPPLRESLLEQLLEGVLDIKTGRVFRTALWIIGEHALSESLIELSMKRLRTAIGEIPIVQAEEAHALTAEANNESPESPQNIKKGSGPKILPDGSYASESAISSKTGPKKSNSLSQIQTTDDRPPLRALLLNGDFYVANVLCATLTKLVIRYAKVATNDAKKHALRAEVLLMMTSILRLGRSSLPTYTMDEDSLERVLTCLRIVSDMDTEYEKTASWQKVAYVLLKLGREAYGEALKAEELRKKNERQKGNVAKAQVQVDDPIDSPLFLNSSVAGADSGLVSSLDTDVHLAAGLGGNSGSFKSKLSRVVQLTGFSDPIYAEAYVVVNKIDILLDVLIVNQTNSVLQNCTLELATLGDLKLVERPTPTTIEPHGFHSVKASVKVSSTETGVIFGNIVYDGPSAVDSRVVILYDIHVDIMDYIKPAECSEIAFRTMWTEFEWENKVNVHLKIGSLREFLDLLKTSTNMACLTPDSHLNIESDFLAANLYARTLFGEDALANICLEMQKDTVVGHIRIRSRTQGIALSLGDKITIAQRNYSLPKTLPIAADNRANVATA